MPEGDSLLIFSVANCTGIRNYVTDVRYTGEVHNDTLKAKTEAGVLCAAVLAEVHIPPVILFLKAKLLHACGENLESFLTLRAADDLADAGNEKVHCGNGLAVVVLAHIERLDLLGVIDKEDGLLINLLGEVALVLGLKVNAPIYRELEVCLRLFEDLDSLGIGYLCVISITKVGKASKESLVNEAVEELELCLAVIHYVVDDVLDHIPSELHIVIKIRKCDLRLDHPELCRVTCGVGVLCSEGRTEGVDVTERHSVGLALKLTRNGEVCALAEEVLGEINGAVLTSGGIVHVKGGNSEHLACALCIGAGDDGGVHVNESAAVEEGVDSKRYLASYSVNCGEKVGSGAEVSLLAEELNRVALRLKGVIGGRGSLYCDLGRLKLEGLLCAGGEGKDTRNDKRCTNVLRCDLVVVIYFVSLKDYLNALEVGAVVEVNKAKGLGIAKVSYPSAESHALAAEGLAILINASYESSFHFCSPCFIVYNTVLYHKNKGISMLLAKF